MKQLSILLLLVISFTTHAQNVGIGVPAPLYKLDVYSPVGPVARFTGSSAMYMTLYESNFYRGYLGSWAGSAEDVDFGTGGGNTTGSVHLTIQGIPKLSVTASGSVDVQNELTRSSKTGNANLLPIAYGNISAAGFVQASSGNVSVSHTITGFYDITITGENYQFQQYITVVTPIGSTTPVISTTGSGAGRLQVFLYSITGADIDGNFHFVIYKP
ncbi:hypothetical protein [Paraflavitalea sp. CAU 1676]|uniref:hypothetical protein n=1 Tax=Paraflavitalea sp. CAU 1676 TaxID=3032598 RepID=UPI0023DABB80|nr:hypothetical protein [Paraflavitalea sp. CAU 1676]MDF2193030.1 hypothetical protein [Paraflavitalea sp. CAU 1676]